MVVGARWSKTGPRLSEVVRSRRYQARGVCKSSTSAPKSVQTANVGRHPFSSLKVGFLLACCLQKFDGQDVRPFSRYWFLSMEDSPSPPEKDRLKAVISHEGAHACRHIPWSLSLPTVNSVRSKVMLDRESIAGQVSNVTPKIMTLDGPWWTTTDHGIRSNFASL